MDRRRGAPWERLRQCRSLRRLQTYPRSLPKNVPCSSGWTRTTRWAPTTYLPDLTPITGVAASPQGQLLRSVALAAFQRLSAEALEQGHSLTVSSAYRSFREQESTYSYWVSRLGPIEAGRISAKAGHSEHQLGTTVDVTSASVRLELTEAFGTAPEGMWLQANAQRFGFTMSYPDDKESVTGYAYEPWHWRYVGETMATWLQRKGLTLTEWLRTRSSLPTD